MSTVKYINGSGKPRIKVVAGGDAPTSYTFDFPLTGQGGLNENWVSDDIEGEMIDIDTLEESSEWYNGYWRGYFTLDYSEFLPLPYSLYIQSISDYQRSGYTVYLIPRVDRPDREFKVRLLNDFSFGINKNGTSAIGNTGFMMKFKTIDTYEYGQWINANLDTVTPNFYII